MALNINHSSTNGKSFLLKVGVSKEVLADLLDAGWDVKLTAKTLTLFKGDVKHEAPMDLTTLNAVSSGTITPLQKAKLLEQVKQLTQAAFQGAAPVTIPATHKVSYAASVGPAEPAFKEPKPAQFGKWAIFDPKKMHTAPLTKLRDATHMYQPVNGTSPGSRYFVVAANDELRLAARYREGTLSVRIEGPGWKAHQAAILACGFEGHAGKDYASLHVTVGKNTVLANKTLGAIVTGLGLHFDTQVPNAKVIAE